MRRRFLSAPTSPRPPLAPWPGGSLARSPKRDGRASQRTWPRTPWLESHQPPEAESRSEALRHGTSDRWKSHECSLQDRCIRSRELLPVLPPLPACGSAGQRNAQTALVIRLGSRDGDHRSDADQGERPEADDRYRVHKTLHEQHDRSDVQSRGVAQVPTTTIVPSGPVGLDDPLELLRVKGSALRMSRTPMPAHPVASRRTSLASANFVAMELPAKLPISSTAASWLACGQAYKKEGRARIQAAFQCQKQNHSVIPNRILKRVERYLQIPSPVALGLRKPSAPRCSLQGRKDQLRHRQRSVRSSRRDTNSSSVVALRR